MFIDINDVDGSELVREKVVGTNLDKIRVATRGTGIRIVFDSGQDGLFSYDIKTVPQGLLVTIDEKGLQATKNKKLNTASAIPSDPTLEALIDSSEAALSDKAQMSGDDVSAMEAMQDSFEFSGYKATRISVDFYKIDLQFLVDRF